MTMTTESLRTIHKTINGDSLTPILIFRRLVGAQKFLLESHDKHDGSGRYSFIGMDPIKAFRGKGRQLEEYLYKTGKSYTHEGELLTLLKRLMPRITTNIDFPFTGGAVGYVSYEASQKSQSQSENYDVYFNIYETVIVFDHLMNEVTVLKTKATVEDTPDSLDTLIEQITVGNEVEESFALGQFEATISQNEFERRVQEGQKLIAQGQLEQIVLSQKFEADFTGDAFHVYRQLRKKNPSPYMYYMEMGETVIVGTSPESLVKVKEGRVITNPIAGTRKRGKDAVKNVAMVEELLTDEKELMEHEMLVTSSWEELTSICDADSVVVTKDKEVVHYEHVMHLVSEVEGNLSEGRHPLDALESCLPAGTVTGSPKRVAMDYITQLEPEPRGIYGGAIGYVGFNGQIDFALTIRTMTIENGKASVQAGAGVVAKSTPTAEYKETLNKARSLLDIQKV